jgi:hypothetical protein
MYRFEKQYLIKIVQHLLPITPAGEGVLAWPRGKPPSECHTYNILEALLGTLNQLAQSHTLFAMGSTFGHSEERLSEMINSFTYFLIEDTTEFSAKLQNLEAWASLSAETADAFQRVGFPYENCFLLIDGKIFRTAKANDLLIEHASFSYHSKCNGQNFQLVVGAHGVVLGFWGPDGGRTPDANQYRDYGIEEQIEAADAAAQRLFPNRNYQLSGFHCFGDGAYPRSMHMQKGLISPSTRAEREFNHSCNTTRVAVEQTFHCIVSLFPYVDTARKMKIMKQCVGHKVRCAVIFHNWHTCMYGNQVGAYFNVMPPTFEQYCGI